MITEYYDFTQVCAYSGSISDIDRKKPYSGAVLNLWILKKEIKQFS